MSSPHTAQIDSHQSRLDAKRVLSLLVLIGFTAVTAQVVLMREVMAVFSGNEMSLGLTLACWLLWTALGSGVLGRFANRTAQPPRLMAILEVLAAIALPMAIYLVRISRSFFQSVPGEILGPGPMLLTSLLALSVFCLVSGGLFAAGSRLYVQERGAAAPEGTGRVYLWEAVGSCLGGMLASLALIRHFRPFQIAALLSLLNLSAAAGLTIRSPLRRKIVLGLLALFFLFVVFPFGCHWIEEDSLARLWRGYHLLATRNSVYGNLAVAQTGGIRTMFENGLVVFNAPDPSAAEEAVHFALLEHPSPKSLLLVGGGLNGSLAQALQHSSLERIDYVELDPAILGMAKEYFPVESSPIRLDSRVHVHPTDGRLFLKTTTLRFDVIIINVPDPQTAQLNRFYTDEFFREAAARLAPAGVFSFQLKGAEDYIGPELAEFLRCIFKTTREVFPEVVTIPGDTIHFIASTRHGSLTVSPEELIARLRARNIHTSYVREYYLPYRMMPDRLLDLETRLRPRKDTRANHDFAPVAYYFDVALCSTRFNRAYRHSFQSIGQLRFGLFVVVLGFILLALVTAFRWAPGLHDRLRAGAAFCVAAMGFTLIGLEMLLLLGFQAIYGYVYQQLAIIIAGFMAGIALGSMWGLRPAPVFASRFARSRDVRSLLTLQFLAAFSPLLLCLFLQAFARGGNPPVLFFVSQILFPLLAVICGLFGGYQFPIASRIYFDRSNRGATGPGTLYALDLAGACLGALALTSFLIPVFGFLQTAFLMAAVNLAPAALLVLLAWEKRASPV